MSSLFFGRGNLGKAPELRYVKVDGEAKPVCELSIYFSRRVPDGNGGFVDKGGFWRDVNFWGQRGEQAAKILVSGARVFVVGVEVQEKWENAEGVEQHKISLTAESIDLDLISIESVNYRAKRPAPAAEESLLPAT